jgi:tetratricopeptide (TPR) repeat protein
MGEPSPSAALNVLAEVYRDGRTGVLTLGLGDASVRLGVRDGQTLGIVVSPETDRGSDSLPSRPDDSARMKLDRVLEEVGLASHKGARKARKARKATAASAADLRERLVAALVDPAAPGELDEAAELPASTVPVAGGTEPLMLEAVRRLPGAEAVRTLLGDLDRRLVTTGSLATEERTLTLTEGYILSRIDGQSTVRQVLQLVPIDRDDTERSMLGLILTGRVRAEATPKPADALRSDPAEAPEGSATDGPTDHIPLDLPLGDDASSAEEETTSEAPADEPLAAEDDPELIARRREILELFQALPLRNHFQVLGLEPGCSDEEVRRAHITHVKRYHPDMQRDPRLVDLHDVLEAIFIRVGEAWEVLGSAKSRAAYEARLGVRPRVVAIPGPSSEGQVGSPGSPDSDQEMLNRMSSEDVLVHAKRLIRAERYWEAIRFLETGMPRLQPRRQEHRGRILLARAYAQNPNWVRKAEETLHNVVQEDPSNVDALYELGRVYKASQRIARAQAMFKKVLEINPAHRGATAEVEAPEPRPTGGLLSRLFKRGS